MCCCMPGYGISWTYNSVRVDDDRANDALVTDETFQSFFNFRRHLLEISKTIFCVLFKGVFHKVYLVSIDCDLSSVEMISHRNSLLFDFAFLPLAWKLLQIRTDSHLKPINWTLPGTFLSLSLVHTMSLVYTPSTLVLLLYFCNYFPIPFWLFNTIRQKGWQGVELSCGRLRFEHLTGVKTHVLKCKIYL